VSHTTHGGDAIDIVDYGNAPVTYVNGLARVDVMGSDALFALWQQRTTVINGRATRTREVVQNIVMPVDAVGPGIELTVATFGPRLLLSGAAYAVRWLTF